MSRSTPSQCLIDTDVASFHFNRDTIRVARYAPHLENATLYVSFATIAEMRFRALLRGWGPRRLAELDEFLADYLIVESHPEIGRAWARIRVESRRAGRPIEPQDAWIVATAIFLDIPLVTHNASHFAQIHDVSVLTESDSSA